MNQKFYHGASSFSAGLQDGEKGALRDADRAYHLHAFLPLPLFFEKLSLPGNVSAVAFRRYVFAESRDRRSGNNFPADCSLNCDFEHLPGYFILEAFAGQEPPGACAIPVHDLRQGIDFLPVNQDIQEDKASFPVIDHVIVKGAIALGDGLETVIIIIDDLGEGYFIDEFHPAGTSVVEG